MTLSSVDQQFALLGDNVDTVDIDSDASFDFRLSGSHLAHLHWSGSRVDFGFELVAETTQC